MSAWHNSREMLHCQAGMMWKNSSDNSLVRGMAPGPGFSLKGAD